MYSHKPPHLSAPPPAYGQPPFSTGVSPSPPTSWSSGLCDCCVDIPNCCLTCVCPCIIFGQIAAIVDKGTTSCGVHGVRYAIINILGLGCLYSCAYRTKLRRQQGLPEVPTNDCCVHFCCGPCALCQEYRELQWRGYDMSIGWHEGMNRPMHGVQIPPVTIGGMNR